MFELDRTSTLANSNPAPNYEIIIDIMESQSIRVVTHRRQYDGSTNS